MVSVMSDFYIYVGLHSVNLLKDSQTCINNWNYLIEVVIVSTQLQYKLVVCLNNWSTAWT